MTIIDVELIDPDVIDVELLPAGPPGRDGEPGPQGAPGAGFLYELPELAEHAIWHPLGRMPSVQVYVDHELVDTDVTSDQALVTITFPFPTACVAILT